MIRLIPARVLVLDDDEAVCRKVLGWLHEDSLDATTFTTLEPAVIHATNGAPHVALVDLRLADVDGPQAIAALLAANPSLRIIALAAFPDVPLLVGAVRAGARDVLEKPLQPGSMVGAVRRQLTELGICVRGEEEFNRRLGARLRAIRTRADRTLAVVAEASGLTAAQLSQIELGRSGTTTWTLARICGALETPLAAVLGTA